MSNTTLTRILAIHRLYILVTAATIMCFLAPVHVIGVRILRMRLAGLAVLYIMDHLLTPLLLMPGVTSEGPRSRLLKAQEQAHRVKD